MKRTIVLAGGTGLIGQSIIRNLKGFQFVVLTRSKPNLENGVKYIHWNGKDQGLWTKYLEGTYALINLCGRSVDCRYDAENKDEILISRLQPTLALGLAISRLENPPPVWLNMSSATIYPHSTVHSNCEYDPPGYGFSSDVVQKWEETFFECAAEFSRPIALRTSFFLSKHGGVYPSFRQVVRMLPLIKSFGQGDQWISWIHEVDFSRAISFLLKNKGVEGIINVTSPGPVRNKTFIGKLKSNSKLPGLVKFPTWSIDIGAWLMGTEKELIMKSRFVAPMRLLDQGFNFQYENIEDAIRDLEQIRSFNLVA